MLASNLGPREDYTTVEIRIYSPAVPGEDYPVELSVLAWRTFPRCTIQIDHANMMTIDSDPRAYGQALGQMFFADDALGLPYREALAAVQGRGNGLRVRLRIDPPELQALHWERSYHPLAGEWHPLGSTATTPFSRFVPAQQWDRPTPVTQRPLRMLTVIASPADLDKYQLDTIGDQERQALHSTLDGLPEVEVTYLESGTASPSTLNAIRQALAIGYHLVHVLCHGAHTKGGTVLYLERENGEVDPVTSERLVAAFKAVSTPPPLCFLSSCESGMRARHDAFVPLGPALVEDGGVQAVVAMSDRVGLSTAQTFAGQFYARLLAHGMVDLAVNEARALVQDEWDWGVPVLFSRLPDNQLLDFPIGRFYDRYLSHADRAYLAADEALAAARLEDHGSELVDDLERLIKELSKSHEVMVGVASKFRRTGNNPDTFAQRFEGFFYDFKDYYDSQSWVDEDTSCREISELSYRVLPKLAPLLDDTTFEQLRAELELLSNADADLLHYLREYLDTMNNVVEEIYSKVTGGDIDKAIGLKRGFEAQISPSFRRSKEMFDRMSGSITAVAAV